MSKFKFLTNYQLDRFINRKYLRNNDFGAGVNFLTSASWQSYINDDGTLKKQIQNSSGVVFTIINLDKITGFGNHWVALWMIVKNKKILYALIMDPYDGRKYNSYTANDLWLKGLKKFVELNRVETLYDILKNKHSENSLQDDDDIFCGAYSIGLLNGLINNLFVSLLETDKKLFDETIRAIIIHNVNELENNQKIKKLYYEIDRMN